MTGPSSPLWSSDRDRETIEAGSRRSPTAHLKLQTELRKVQQKFKALHRPLITHFDPPSSRGNHLETPKISRRRTPEPDPNASETPGNIELEQARQDVISGRKDILVESSIRSDENKDIPQSRLKPMQSESVFVSPREASRQDLDLANRLHNLQLNPSLQLESQSNTSPTIPRAETSIPEPPLRSTTNPALSAVLTKPAVVASTNSADNQTDVPNSKSNLKFNAEWQKISRLREFIWGLRSKVQQQRAMLREKQYAKAAIDDKYVQRVRLLNSGNLGTNVILGVRDKTLEELYQESEKARAEFGPLEDDCNLMEDQLGSLEFELTRLEEIFVGKWKQPPLLISGSQETKPTSRSNESQRSGYSSVQDHQEYHPFVAEYLSKMGDIDILRERLEVHKEEVFSLESERTTRRRVNISLASEDQNWLDRAKEIEDDILKELEEAMGEVEKLKNKCLAEKLLDKKGEPKDFKAREHGLFQEDKLDSDGAESEYIKYPVLLPYFGSKQPDFGTYAPKEEEKSDNAGDHINQWLLHQLRSSPLDVNLLASTFERHFGPIESEYWQSEVIKKWYKDGAIKDTASYRVYSASTTSEKPPAEMSLSYSSGEKLELMESLRDALTRGGYSDYSGSGSELGYRSEDTATGARQVVGSLPRVSSRRSI